MQDQFTRISIHPAKLWNELGVAGNYVVIHESEIGGDKEPSERKESKGYWQKRVHIFK
jgi:hypothetical protein